MRFKFAMSLLTTVIKKATLMKLFPPMKEVKIFFFFKSVSARGKNRMV